MVEQVDEAALKLHVVAAFVAEIEVLAESHVEVVDGAKVRGVASAVGQGAPGGVYVSRARIGGEVCDRLAGAVEQRRGAGADIRISARIDEGAVARGIAVQVGSTPL